MALVLVGGAALEAVFGELLSAIIEMKKKAVMFRDRMEQLEDTIESLAPVIKEIQLYNNVLNRPRKEIERIIKVMEKGKELVCKCSKIRQWDLVRKLRYQEKLRKLDKSLVRFLNVDMQAQMARDQKQTLLAVNNIVMPLDHGRYPNLTVGVSVSKIGRSKIEVVSSVLKVDFHGIEKIQNFARIMELGVKSASINKDKWHATVRCLFVPPELEDIFSQKMRLVNQCSETDHQLNWQTFDDFSWHISTLFNSLGFYLTTIRERDRFTLRTSSESEMRIIARGIEAFSSIVLSRNPLAQQYERFMMPSSCTSDRNGYSAMTYQNPNTLRLSDTMTESRISEYDERNKDRLCYCCEGENCRYIKWLGHPADETSAGEYSGKHGQEESEKIIAQNGPLNLIMQRLDSLEGTASRLNLLTPAFLISCCFNLVLSFVLLIYLWK